MLGRWIRRALWVPFETLCRRTPLWPFRVSVSEPLPDIYAVTIDNTITRALSALAGGYPYAVLYVVAGEVMIDSGFPWARNALRRLVLERGWDESLRRVVNTHYHEDHVGNNDLIASLCDAEICAHPVTAIEARLPPRLSWYRRFLFGPAKGVKTSPVPTRFRAGGRTYEVIETPGHCPGHICVFELERRVLFSGDLFVAPDLDTQLPDVDGPAWIQSLDACVQLAPESMLDGHGTVVHGRAAVLGALEEKRDFLKALDDRVRANWTESTSIDELCARCFTDDRLAERIALGDGWMSVLTGSEFSREHLVRSFALRHMGDELRGAGR